MLWTAKLCIFLTLLIVGQHANHLLVRNILLEGRLDRRIDGVTVFGIDSYVDLLMIDRLGFLIVFDLVLSFSRLWWDRVLGEFNLKLITIVGARIDIRSVNADENAEADDEDRHEYDGGVPLLPDRPPPWVFFLLFILNCIRFLNVDRFRSALRLFLDLIFLLFVLGGNRIFLLGVLLVLIFTILAIFHLY